MDTTDTQPPPPTGVEQLHQALDGRAADPLAAAEDHLASLAAAETDWERAQFIGALATIADHTRRVMLDTASPHYRADKAGPIVYAALKVQRSTIFAYAGLPEVVSGPASNLERTTSQLAEIAETFRSLMWDLARREGGSGWVWASTHAEARQALANAIAWIDTLPTIPDPED